MRTNDLTRWDHMDHPLRSVTAAGHLLRDSLLLRMLGLRDCHLVNVVVEQEHSDRCVSDWHGSRCCW